VNRYKFDLTHKENSQSSLEKAEIGSPKAKLFRTLNSMRRSSSLRFREKTR